LPLALLDQQERLIAGMPPPPPSTIVPVRLNGATIGWLLVPKVREIRSGFEQ
jgi:hypothetical protein